MEGNKKVYKIVEENGRIFARHNETGKVCISQEGFDQKCVRFTQEAYRRALAKGRDGTFGLKVWAHDVGTRRAQDYFTVVDKTTVDEMRENISMEMLNSKGYSVEDIESIFSAEILQDVEDLGGNSSDTEELEIAE